MMKVKGIFAVSLIAMVAVVAGTHTSNAVAAIASQGYVDQQIDTKVSTTQGSGNANKAVITNASGNIITGTISSAMITDGTITNADIASNAQIAQSKISGLTTALAGKANTDDVPTKTSDLTNDSGFITSSDLPGEYELPVATADTLGGVKSGGDITVATSGAVTVNSATKATQDASGNVITSTYATKADVGSKLSSISGSTTGTGNVVTNVLASGSAVSATKGITAEETKNKVKSVRAVASATDTAYPSEKAVATALAGKVATAQGSAAANKAVITNASGNITTGTISSGMIANDAVTSAKLAAGAVDATALASDAVTSAKIADGTITNADIASNAAIEASKVDGLAKVATSGLYNDLTGKPTIPTVNNGQLTINVNGTPHSFTANQAGGTTVDIDIPDEVDFSGLSGSTTGSGNVVTNVTQTNGNVSATKGITAEETKNKVKSVRAVASATDTAYPSEKAVATALAGKVDTSALSGYATIKALDALDSSTSGSGAVVTNVSQTDGKVSVDKGNVQIPVGSATATTYATIWVE